MNQEVLPYFPSSFEGFEFIMKRLEDHPEQKKELIRHWKQGFAETKREMDLAYDDAIKKAGVFYPVTLINSLRKEEKFSRNIVVIINLSKKSP